LNTEGLTREEQMRRGRVAKELLDNEVLTDAFAEVKREQIDRWLATGNEAARPTILALDLVREELRRWISNAEVEAEILRRNP
jgi:hypothetical protein